MLHSIFESFGELAPSDIMPILTLALLEGILSADNALVLSVLVKDLPNDRKRIFGVMTTEKAMALKVGILCAYLFRFIAVFIAGFLLQWSIVKWAGGAYLIWLGVKGMFFSSGHNDAGFAGRFARWLGVSPFWQAVIAIELTDIVFSVDSITAAVAFSPKLAVVFLGGCAGILAMRFAAGVFGKLMERYTVLEKTAFLLVLIIGFKLVAAAGAFPGVFGMEWFSTSLHIPHWLGTSTVVGIFFGAIFISHFFPNSYIAKIGRKDAKELEDEMKLQADQQP